MIDDLSLAIINRRLEARARAGASFLGAQTAAMNESRSLEGTYLAIKPTGDNWRGAIHDVRAVIADALARAPSTEEIAREAAEMNIAYVSQVEQRSLQPGGRLADEMVGALDIHETVTSPEGMLKVFRLTVPHATPESAGEAEGGLLIDTEVFCKRSADCLRTGPAAQEQPGRVVPFGCHIYRSAPGNKRVLRVTGLLLFRP